MHLSTYLERHPPRPSRRPPANQDELRRLGASDGVALLTAAPMSRPDRAVPRRSGDPGCHLWVFEATGIPYVLETRAVVPPLETGKIKHSNLTGGGVAASGGELWVNPADPAHVYINGCSGRYGPETEQELLDSEAVIRGLGYAVTSFGWDSDTGLPARVLR